MIKLFLLLTASTCFAWTDEPHDGTTSHPFDWEFAHPDFWSHEDGMLRANVTRRVDTQALVANCSVADVLLQTNVRFTFHYGRHNRHDDGTQGCDFAFSVGTFIHLFATLCAVTGERTYLDRARIVADWHWKNRHATTALPADCPGLTTRYDGTHTFTTFSGPHAMLLLEAYRESGEEYFRDLATT